MSDKKGQQADYVWVIVESAGDDENFVGLSDSQSGETFVPVTSEREQGLMLLGRLPAGPQGAKREVEAIHKKRILELAGGEGFSVYLVDQDGKFLGRLDQAAAH